MPSLNAFNLHDGDQINEFKREVKKKVSSILFRV